MADFLTKTQRSRNMQAIKNKGSKIETLLSKSLWNRGLRFRKNVRDVCGKPDIAIKKYKIALFADSEFWHGKNWSERKSDFKTNKEFWTKKIERNIERDKEVNQKLEKKGWIVLRYWGDDIKNNTEDIVNEVMDIYETRRNEFEN